jgi:Calx-beta domain
MPSESVGTLGNGARSSSGASVCGSVADDARNNGEGRCGLARVVRRKPIDSLAILKARHAAADSGSMLARVLAVFCAFFALAVLPGSASAAPKKVMLKFSATNYSVVENAGTFNVTVLRSGNTSAAASIQYSDNGTGTATGGGVNYSFTGGTLNFAAGETSKTFPVTIVDNGTADAPNKTIVFRLANATPAGSQIKTTTAKLTIIDDEGPGTLDFSSSAYTVLEGADLATVTVNRIGAPNLTVSVDYATQTALANPASPISDYTPISPAQTLTFNPGELSKTFQVAVADDSDAEGPENVNLVLSNSQNLTAGAAPQIGPNGPAVLTINDDDVSTFSFGAPAYFVQEDDPAGHATITVNRAGATNIPASVDYSTSDGTAVAGSDYTAASGTLDFAAGETSKTFDVEVSNDGAAEANETVNLTLTSGVTKVDTSLLSIVDNDNSKTSVQLSSPTYNVNEADGTATVTVSLSHAVDADVTVDYATVDGTAGAGSDYIDTHGTLTFTGNVNNGGPGTGQTSKTIEIPITQDPDAEDPETLTLTLSNALPGASSILGAPSTGTVTIADDDPLGEIDFKSLRYDVDETDGQATVTVERLGGVGGAVSVDYATSDGSATAGSDYAATSGTLHWAAGDSADKTFTVPVSWDGRAEGSESINLALTNPGGGSELGATTAAVLDISDDGASGPLALSSNAYGVSEADGMVTITVTRSVGSLGGPVTVDYATSDGTAAAGSDYAAVSGTLTFGPAEASKSFTVPVTSDSTHEGDEALQVTLSHGGGGASIGSPSGATVTITDDDAAPAGPANPPAPPAAPDTTAPRLTLAAKRTQRALKAKLLALSARCNEQCKLAAVAKVRIGTKNFVLGRAKATAPPGRTAKMKLKLSKKTLVKLHKAMKRGKAKVVLSVSAADAAGNKAAASRRVTVKR